MWMTPLDVATFMTQVIGHVARRLAIPDFELKSATELMKEIGERDEKVSGALLDFALAYEEWYAVHELIERAGSSDRRHQLLTERLRNRDATRAALKATLAKYK